MKIQILIVCLLASSRVFAESMPQSITLATTDWCPYACEHSSIGPGFVAEYLTDIFKSKNMVLNVRSLPWSRAITMAQLGEVDGLLTAAASEMQGLLPTTVPIGNYKVCFYTNKESDWIFKNTASLKGRKFGIIADYSYGEPMDSFIRDAANKDSLIAKHGSSDLGILFEMLAAHRTDATLDDVNVIKSIAKSGRIQLSSFREAGCMAPSPFFVALNPNKKWGKQVVKMLNAELASSANKAKYQKIAAKYLD
jgi:polar amino acid transport system substrate-binding protein